MINYFLRTINSIFKNSGLKLLISYKNEKSVDVCIYRLTRTEDIKYLYGIEDKMLKKDFLFNKMMQSGLLNKKYNKKRLTITFLNKDTFKVVFKNKNFN